MSNTTTTVPESGESEVLAAAAGLPAEIIDRWTDGEFEVNIFPSNFRLSSDQLFYGFL
jgi:hypothetical protein